MVVPRECLFFLFLLTCWLSPVHAETLEGRVVGVHDGDTITILTAGLQDIRVRLAEIDAPELRQSWGQRSKESLSDLVYGRDVRVEWQVTDRYGRIVGHVYAGDVDVGTEQVRRGFALAYPPYVIDAALYQIEAEARVDHRGLWADPAPVSPWVWRHSSR